MLPPSDELREAQKLLALASFQSGLAHDLNNRLTTLGCHLMFLELECPEQAESIAIMQDAVARAADLVRLQQTFQHREVYPTHPCDLRAVLLDLHDLAARTVGAEIALGWTPPEHPLFVLGDEGTLEQILMNLLVEARSALHGLPGAQLHVDVRDGDRVRLRVQCGADTGLLTADAFTRDGDPGWRAAETLLHALGAGLSLQERDGTYSLDAELKPTPPPFELPQSPRPAVPKGTRVLLCEGHPGVRNDLVTGLTRAGCEVTGLADVATLEALIQRTPGAGWCFFDCLLPGGGEDAVRKILPTGYHAVAIHPWQGFGRTSTGPFVCKPLTANDLLKIIQEEQA